ncbi:IS3 family transposase [Nocardioides aequoreus]|uniref:IS3 family transposase n=1 Tax=Nocardioides aequoreus TaxID=397278 RepID=UPI0012F67684|nr:IS3 family transposase [Nocardioides aequoreus]
MARPSRYPTELRERAVRMVMESRQDYPHESAAIRSVAAKLGITSTESLRKWLRQAEIDGGVRQGRTSEEIAEIKALKKENAELRRANEILKSASGFLRGGARPPQQVLIDYIEDHKMEFGVEPICRVLTEHGIKIAPSTFYETRSRQPSRQQVRDAELVEIMVAERKRQKLIARFGARKMWLHLRGRGHDVARCTIERLYREQGWVGALRLKKVRTTLGDPAAERPLDLVDRQFWASRPNQLWVADFTYVATWAGTVYVAFVFDVFSRRIVGWRAATRMTTDLVLDTLEHAIWTRQQAGVTDLSGLIHHTDAGSQYVSFAFTQRLVDEGVDPSVGSVGDAYDNALAESQIGLYKAELIRPEGPWRGVEHVELETLNWVDFFNNERPHEALDDLTPIAAEELHYAARNGLQPTG